MSKKNAVSTSVKTNQTNKPVLRNQYSPRLDLALKFKNPSRTKQAFKDECDINNIINRYTDTNHISHINRSEPQYGFAPSESFHEAIMLVESSTAQFKQLPAKLRARFNNDPEHFLGFMQDPANASEMASLGLFTEGSPSASFFDSESSGEPPAPPEPAPQETPTPS